MSLTLLSLLSYVTFHSHPTIDSSFGPITSQNHPQDSTFICWYGEVKRTGNWVTASTRRPVIRNLLVGAPYTKLNTEINFIWQSWVGPSQIYSNIYPTRCNFTHFIYIWKLLYMFRMLLPPIIRSAYNCIYNIWYLSHRYCYLPL